MALETSKKEADVIGMVMDKRITVADTGFNYTVITTPFGFPLLRE
ncbi:MAG: hypothetical protein WCJ49_04620 [Deltaproteobacteria bacterium]